MMSPFRIGSIGWALAVLGALVTGCQSSERASVSFSYVVDADRGLPPGLDTIAIMPAKIGPTTDEKWSDLCATTLRSLIHDSRDRLGTEVTVTDRRDTQVTFDEADLAAAGMSTASPGAGGKLLAADAVILSNINVKIERHIGYQRTISGLSVAGGHNRWYGDEGSADIRTREVETITRAITVQLEFKLVDTSNNKVWAHFSPPIFSTTDRTEASPLFGSSQTEAELTPTDEIVRVLVERAARQFVSQLMPCRIDVRSAVVSSRDSRCIQGVKLLRAELFDQARLEFSAALARNPDDHRAAYGAGVASEATGRFDDALDYYRRACIGAGHRAYLVARDRLKAYGHRARS